MLIKQQKNDKGQVGIGTLIIFIALVLVATVGASVLIDTALTTEERAQQTGEESIQEVSDRLDVIDKLGETDSSGEVDTVRVQTGISAGADRVDLTEAQVSFVGDSDTVLTYGGDNPGVDEFGVNVLSDQSGDLGGERPVVTERGDVAELEIALGEVDVVTETETFNGVDLSTNPTLELDNAPINNTTNAVAAQDGTGTSITVDSIDKSAGEVTVSGTGTNVDITVTYDFDEPGPVTLQERDEVDLTLRTGAGAESNAILRTPSPLRSSDTFTFE